MSSREVRMKLKGKRALITGGNSGIGLATARLFVAEGARVAITGRNQATLDAAAKELGPKVLAIRSDSTDPDNIDKAIVRIAEQFDGLDVLFANAGIGGKTPLGDTSLEQFEQILKTNLTGVFFTIQAAAPYLSDGASVIMNGSVHSVQGWPAYSAYAASKAGLRAMSRVLASELYPRGIRVNVVSPGATRTPIWDKSAPSVEQKAALETSIARAVQMGRLAEAEEIAKAVLFLASDDSSYIQSMEIFVDGGATGSPMGAPIFRT
jgi:NAD(P)-dependent dehydrogenase (short-subunit alcohol dehydrogenase family)